jgi:hypothetical protein
MAKAKKEWGTTPTGYYSRDPLPARRKEIPLSRDSSITSIRHSPSIDWAGWLGRSYLTFFSWTKNGEIEKRFEHAFILVTNMVRASDKEVSGLFPADKEFG